MPKLGVQWAAMDKKPRTLNDWSLRSEWENAALFVLAVGLVFSLVGLFSAQRDMTIFGVVVIGGGLLAFLYFNAKRTKKR